MLSFIKIAMLIGLGWFWQYATNCFLDNFNSWLLQVKKQVRQLFNKIRTCCQKANAQSYNFKLIVVAKLLEVSDTTEKAPAILAFRIFSLEGI